MHLWRHQPIWEHYIGPKYIVEYSFLFLLVQEVLKLLVKKHGSYSAKKHIFMKLLKTTNTDIVKYSQYQFGFKLPSELISTRTAKFIAKLQASDSV